MNKQNVCWKIIIMFLGLVLAARADDSIDKDVQRHVDQCSSVETKIEYLSSVVAGKADSSDITKNIRKSSAIILLGKIGGTNVIDILMTNLIYIDSRYNGSPASHALVLIGEPAVPQLLKVLKDSGGEEPQETVADMRAKLVAGYKESIEEQRIRFAALTIARRF